MIRHILHFGFITFASVMLSMTTAHANSNAYQADYAGLLATHVSSGTKEGIGAALVNYDAWGKDARHKQALEALLKVDPSVLKGKKKMVFWINAYNLLTIDLIIKTGEKESIKNQGSLLTNVWKKHKWTISGKSYTLDQIEHKILRPMGDARIHVAINCASLSCPDLLDEPYTVTALNAQLTKQSKLFVMSTSKGVRATDDGLVVSKIFDWFAEDFAGKKGAEKFIQQYSASAPANASITDYLDYNWSLNSQ